MTLLVTVTAVLWALLSAGSCALVGWQGLGQAHPGGIITKQLVIAVLPCPATPGACSAWQGAFRAGTCRQQEEEAILLL